MQTKTLLNVHSKLALVLGAVVWMALALPSEGQQFSVAWHKVSGGGRSSTNSPFAISGTVGQHDAGGPMIGGTYTVTGGFWSLYAMQTSGTPALGITVSPTNTVTVFWPSPSTGWNLQVNTNLSSTNWVTPPETVNDNGTIKYIIVSPPTGNRYYRLINP
jgi:hypothetical protein